MKNFHPPIQKLIEHYARKTKSKQILEILSKGDVSTEADAQALFEFLDVMSDAIGVDAQNNVSVLENERVHTSDAVKVSEVVESYLEQRGFGHLLPDD
jgi:hypothetical protein